MAPSPTAAETLAALLAHTDGDTLVALLDGKNLLTLLRHAGRSEADVARALRVEKRAPGELLLELLREGRTPSELVDVLGPDAVLRARRDAEKKQAARDGAKGADAPEGMGLWYALAAIGVVPALLGTLDAGLASAMLAAGPGPVALGVGLAGAAAGAALAKPARGRAHGALAGAVTCLGMFVATYVKVTLYPGAPEGGRYDRSVVLAALAGGLPGIGLHLFNGRAGAGG